jgi:hypothetical protein
MKVGKILPLRHLETVWIPRNSGNRLAARIWMPQDAKAKDGFAGRRVSVIVTGGNVDLDMLPWLKN